MTHYENIPGELKELNQWVCTRSDSKVPMKAFENEAASSTNPQTWATFDMANDAVSKGFYDYCGFVFADNGFVGIDIDTGYDEEGFMTPLAARHYRQVCELHGEIQKRQRFSHSPQRYASLQGQEQPRRS